jgi:acetyltransferase-like isoleucine patch superfamily enzyme
MIGFSNVRKSNIHSSAVLHRNAEVILSQVDQNCIVGNYSRILSSKLSTFVKIDRNNLVTSSILGNYTYTGNSTIIQSSQIGSFCSLSWGVTVGGGEHPLNRWTSHDILYNKRYGTETSSEIGDERYREPVEIQNDVWIGANSVILRGVQIGNGAVVGAGSVVTKNVPDYAIVVGNPAKVVRYRFKDSDIQRLLDSKWWNLDPSILRDNMKSLVTADLETFLHCVENL